MEVFILIMIFVLGLCFGSFVNMLVYRTAVKYKLIKSSRAKSRDLTKKKKKDFSTSVEMTKGTVEMTKGIVEMMKKRFFHFGRNDKFFYINENRSFCDYCGKKLVWFENIPVVSWLIQKGRSRCCQKKLSILYPIVEIVMGILFLINFKFLIFNFYSNQIFLNLNFQTIIQILLSFLIIIFLVFSAVFDIKYMILPDFSTIVLTICAIVFLLVETPDLASLQMNILSAFSSFGFLLLPYLITRGKGMGFGDVKLAFFMGLFLGPLKVIVALYLAFIVGALVGVIGILFGKLNRKAKIAFGPFLILGFFLSWFLGDQILEFLMFNFGFNIF